MADLYAAITYVLKLEDPTLEGKVTKLPDDTGGRTRFGLAERWHPDLTAQGYFDRMPTPKARALAMVVYSNQYGQPMLISSITDQTFAGALLAEAVNTGRAEAVRILQRVLGFTKDQQDGNLGPATLAGINAADAAKLLADYITAQIAFYRQIVLRNPSQTRFLNGWINRARAAQVIKDEA